MGHGHQYRPQMWLDHESRHGTWQHLGLGCQHGPGRQCRSLRSAWMQRQQSPSTSTWPQMWTQIQRTFTAFNSNRSLKHQDSSCLQQRRSSDPYDTLAPWGSTYLSNKSFFHASSELNLVPFLMTVFGYLVLAFLPLVFPSTIPGQFHDITFFTHSSFLSVHGNHFVVFYFHLLLSY